MAKQRQPRPLDEQSKSRIEQAKPASQRIREAGRTAEEASIQSVQKVKSKKKGEYPSVHSLPCPIQIIITGSHVTQRQKRPVSWLPARHCCCCCQCLLPLGLLCGPFICCFLTSVSRPVADETERGLPIKSRDKTQEPLIGGRETGQSLFLGGAHTFHFQVRPPLQEKQCGLEAQSVQ